MKYLGISGKQSNKNCTSRAFRIENPMIGNRNYKFRRAKRATKIDYIATTFPCNAPQFPSKPDSNGYRPLRLMPAGV